MSLLAEPTTGQNVTRALGAALLAAMGIAAGAHGAIGLRDAARVPPAVSVDAIGASPPAPGSRVAVVGTPIADTMVRWTVTRQRWGGLQSSSSHVFYVPLAGAAGPDGARVRVFVLVYPREGRSDVPEVVRATRFIGVVSDGIPERAEALFRQRLRVDPRVILVDTSSEDRLLSAFQVAFGVVLLALAFFVTLHIHPRRATPRLLWRLQLERRGSIGLGLFGLCLFAAPSITYVLQRAPDDASPGIVLIAVLGASTLLALSCMYLLAAALVGGVGRDIFLRSTLRRLGLTLPQLAERIDRELPAEPIDVAPLSCCLVVLSSFGVSVVAYDDIAELALQRDPTGLNLIVGWVVEADETKGRRRWITRVGVSVTPERGAALLEAIAARAPWAAAAAIPAPPDADRLRAFDARRASAPGPASPPTPENAA